MAKPLQIVRDNQSVPTSGSQTAKQFPAYTQTMLLTANTIKDVTVPTLASEAMVAFFHVTFNKSVFLDPRGTPNIAVPTGTVTLDVTELVISGMGRVVTAGQALQFITPDSDAYVTISYYETYTT